MKREQVILNLEYAGYHHDKAQFTFLLCNNRISIQTANRAYVSGMTKREQGVKCNCPECTANKLHIVKAAN